MSISACAAVQRETPLKERVELALALGRIGDPRVVDDLSDPAAWVEVAAGTYRVGDRKLAEEIEKEYSWWKNAALPDETIRFEQPFRLSKYPVTNGQFARFVAAGGYDNQSLWHEAGWKWREENERSRTRTLAGREVERSDAAGGRRVVVGGGRLLPLGRLPAADGTRVGSRRARAAGLGVSLGRRLARGDLQLGRSRSGSDDAGGHLPAFRGRVRRARHGRECLGVVR